MTIDPSIILLTIRGTLNPSAIGKASDVHNQTAGNPQGVAAARALGDLSHNVYVPLDGKPDELLFLDLWNSFDGLGKFFADPQVHTGGNMMFASKDPVVWQPADIRGFSLPAPKGKNDRFIGMIRGVVKSREAAKAAFDAYEARTINKARLAGQLSHLMFYRATGPGEAPSLELLGLDVWMDGEGMGRFYSEGASSSGIYDVFVEPPVSSVWKQPAGSWVEW